MVMFCDAAEQWRECNNSRNVLNYSCFLREKEVQKVERLPYMQLYTKGCEYSWFIFASFPPMRKNSFTDY